MSLPVRLVVIILCVCRTARAAPETWELSLQAGGGRLGAAPAAVVYPRLGASGGDWLLHLGTPLWWRLEPNDAAATRGGPLLRWDSADTYGAFVERLFWRSPEGQQEVWLETLSGVRLGEGELVDGYQGGLDLQHLRPGVRVHAIHERLDFTAMVSGFDRPELVAVAFEGEPVVAASGAPQVRVGLQMAADVFATTADARPSPLLGGAVDLSVSLWRGTWLGVDVTGAATALRHLRLGQGLHGGLRMEVAPGFLTRVVMAMELCHARGGFQPGYFDAAYVLERQATLRAGIPKRSVAFPQGNYLRWRADAAVGPLTMGVRSTLLPDGSQQLSVAAALETPMAHMSLVWLARGLLSPAHLLDRRGFVLAEASWRLLGGAYVFALARHGPTLAAPTIATATWVVGVGHAFGG